MSRRGMGDAQVVSGDVVRTLLVQMETQIEVAAADLADEEVELPVGRLRKRGSRRDATGQVDVRGAQRHGRGVAAQLRTWYRDDVGPSLLWPLPNWASGRRLHIVDGTKVVVPLESGHYACSGKVKNTDGSWERGYTLATLRTVLDTAGSVREAAVAPIQDHDIAVCRRC
jgi:hypothetical protein